MVYCDKQPVVVLSLVEWRNNEVELLIGKYDQRECGPIMNEAQQPGTGQIGKICERANQKHCD
jgi:hypothetical protein